MFVHELMAFRLRMFIYKNNPYLLPERGTWMEQRWNECYKMINK